MLYLFSCPNLGAEELSKPSAITNKLDLIIAASDTPEFINKWWRPPPVKNLHVPDIKETQPGKLVIFSFLITGFTPNAEGDFAVNVSFSLISPNNTEIISEKNYATGRGKAKEFPTYIMANPALDIKFDIIDPLGEYTLIVIVEDLVSNTKTNREYKIKLNPKNA
jgi:hypothetical protein